MGKPFYERFSDLFKPEGQTDARFHVHQLDNCYEALKEAYSAATQDENGKPIFFYSERNEDDPSKNTIVSVHYIDATFGEMKNLNFIAHVIMDVRMFEPTIGVILDGKKFKSGKDVIAQLSRCAKPARDNPNLITARRV